MEKHSSGRITKSIEKLFKRFHLTIFFVFIVACLAGAVILINETLTSGSQIEDYQSNINAGSIDQATLNRIQSLHRSDQVTESPVLPQGRINPFSE
jgi:hypothetical protein